MRVFISDGIVSLSDDLHVPERFTDPTVVLVIGFTSCYFISHFFEKCTNTRDFNPYIAPCHPPVLLITISETGKRDSLRTAYGITTASNRLRYVRPFLTLAAHQLNVYCSMDFPFYIVAAIYSKISILHNYFRGTVGTQASYNPTQNGHNTIHTTVVL